MKLTTSTEADIEQLTEWIAADPYHKECLNPYWWLTGNGLLSYCVQDSKGPTMYVRTDNEDGLMRLHVQYAPESEVSKLRTIKSMMWTFPKMKEIGQKNGLTGFIYRSTSPLLIGFMHEKFKFIPTGFDDDYWVPFEVQ